MSANFVKHVYAYLCVYLRKLLHRTTSHGFLRFIVISIGHLGIGLRNLEITAVRPAFVNWIQSSGDSNLLNITKSKGSSFEKLVQHMKLFATVTTSYSHRTYHFVERSSTFFRGHDIWVFLSMILGSTFKLMLTLA